jgi:hypothetical protein
MSKVAVKDKSTGELVGMTTLVGDAGGPLDQLQRTCDEETPGHVVSWATAEEIRDFELRLRRVN